jgi:hypothetical protein
MFDPALDNGQQELGEREIRDGAAGSASGQHIQVDQDRLSVAAAEICRLLKRKKNLSAESEAELDTYVSVCLYHADLTTHLYFITRHWVDTRHQRSFGFGAICHS